MAKQTVTPTKFSYKGIKGVEDLMTDAARQQDQGSRASGSGQDDSGFHTQFDKDWQQVANLCIKAGKLPKDFAWKEGTFQVNPLTQEIRVLQ